MCEALWSRAVVTAGAAADNLDRYPDLAANRAYYAAFYAVTALFASEETTFRKHTSVRGAVHKELVHTGRWPASPGDDYDKLMELREVADYGVYKTATKQQAADAIERAKRILRAVHNSRPDLFPITDG